MGETANRLPDLDLLTGKVYQAKELISRLRQSNRELASRLEEIQRRLETQEPDALESRSTRPEGAAPSPLSDSKLAAEVERLRRERSEIRERVSHLLQQIESLDI
jgi:uncharacterized coiled-coil DUF342 family protein